jgi:hypothetical protein
MSIKNKIAKLIDLKSILTLLMTFTMIALLFIDKEVDKELLMLFSSTYGAMMTYYFNRSKGDGNNE